MSKASTGWKVALVGLFGATTVMAASAVGASTDSGTASPAHVVRRMHLVEKELDVEMIDLGAPGQSVGDRGTITSEMSDTHGNVVGRADVDCAATALGKRAGGVCTLVLTLPGGQITSQFFSSFTRGGHDNRQAITGGTGEFEGAKGQFVVGEETSNATPVVVELVS